MQRVVRLGRGAPSRTGERQRERARAIEREPKTEKDRKSERERERGRESISQLGDVQRCLAHTTPSLKITIGPYA